MDSTHSHCSLPQYFFLSCENNLLLITSWISCLQVFLFLPLRVHSSWCSLSGGISIEFWLNEILTQRESVRSKSFVLCAVGMGPRRLRKALHMQSRFGIGSCSLMALVLPGSFFALDFMSGVRGTSRWPHIRSEELRWRESPVTLERESERAFSHYSWLWTKVCILGQLIVFW